MPNKKIKKTEENYLIINLCYRMARKSDQRATSWGLISSDRGMESSVVITYPDGHRINALPMRSTGFMNKAENSQLES